MFRYQLTNYICNYWIQSYYLTIFVHFWNASQPFYFTSTNQYSATTLSFQLAASQIYQFVINCFWLLTSVLSGKLAMSGVQYFFCQDVTTEQVTSFNRKQYLINVLILLFFVSPQLLYILVPFYHSYKILTNFFQHYSDQNYGKNHLKE